jgi:hypothetical protein
MGMSYFIYPDRKTSCGNDFGEGLSFFFEQPGGYGETAEVEQVSRILQIDLSLFQDVDSEPEEGAERQERWHLLDRIAGVTDTFIRKLEAQPDYYRQVLHNPDRDRQLDEELRLWDMKDTAARDRRLEELRQQPLYYYPPDYGYLSQGRLLKDLKRLRQTLACYKGAGVEKIRLLYM